MPRRATLEPLNGIGEGLLVDLGVLRPNTVADGAVGGGGDCQLIHWFTPSQKIDTSGIMFRRTEKSIPKVLNNATGIK
jgi:hypothetical protein